MIICERGIAMEGHGEIWLWKVMWGDCRGMRLWGHQGKLIIFGKRVFSYWKKITIMDSGRPSGMWIGGSTVIVHT